MGIFRNLFPRLVDDGERQVTSLMNEVWNTFLGFLTYHQWLLRQVNLHRLRNNLMRKWRWRLLMLSYQLLDPLCYLLSRSHNCFFFYIFWSLLSNK